MTFSIVARCPATGLLGVAVTSSSPAVAARCAFVRSGVGAACSQSLTDPRLGPRLLQLLESGVSSAGAVDVLVQTEPHIAYRQIAVIGADGPPACYSGDHTLGVFSGSSGDEAVAVGNLLASETVVDEMLDAFEREREAVFPERLLLALAAGLDAGGEADQAVRSAGLLVAGEAPWPLVDLRVDWHDEPIRELSSLWTTWQEQGVDYVLRALDPAKAAALAPA